MDRKRAKLVSATLAYVALVASALACGGGDSYNPTAPVPPAPPPPTPSNRDSLSILEVSPPSGSALIAGSSITLRARFAYRFFQAAGGRLNLTLVCAAYSKLTCLDAGSIAELSTPSGEVAVAIRVPTPARSSIKITFWLSASVPGTVSDQQLVTYSTGP